MSRVIFCPIFTKTCVALRLVVIMGLSASGCLGLDTNERQSDNSTPTTDTAPQTCAGISCWEPPQNTCEANDELKMFAPSGYCSGGDCFYSTRQEPCHAGICDEGVCVISPCQGVTCIDPPEASCSKADRTIYAPSGYCDDGTCEYASRTSTCEDACAAGVCVDSPCAEVFCLKPPAPYCEDDSNLLVFAPEGRCAVVDATAECHYVSQTLACDHGCQGGRCLNDPCAGVHCDTPPARHCDDAMLVLYEPHGVCDQDGFCSYGEQRHPCIDPCTDATCGEDDACTWVTCDAPPASYCQDTVVLRVFGRMGWCEAGFCSYVYSDIVCPDGCVQGRCAGTPCVGVSCDKPPAAYCEDTTLISFAHDGECKDDGFCIYPEVPTSCADGCEAGACIDESAKDITQFAILGINGTLGMNTISLTVPLDTDVTSLTPTVTHTGASISPPSGKKTDFSNPVDYTVTALDGSTKVYKVTVSAWHQYVVQGSVPNSVWYSIASSADGTKLAAVAWSDSIYTSTDSGSTWTQRASAGINNWYSIASSTDGTKLAAVAWSDFIYTSADSGATWNQRTSAGNRVWWDIASSADGTKLAAAINADNIYTSMDSGATWTKRTSAGKKKWYCITSSSDGTKLVAAAEADYIYTSTDSGATWAQQTSSGSRIWWDVASSSDGTKLAAAAWGDYIYTSTDSGATWTPRASAGNREWTGIASSSDGTKLAATTWQDYIYTSTDSGTTWTQQTSVGIRDWYCIASSADGSKLAAGVYSSEYIYIFK